MAQVGGDGAQAVGGELQTVVERIRGIHAAEVAGVGLEDAVDIFLDKRCQGGDGPGASVGRYFEKLTRGGAHPGECVVECHDVMLLLPVGQATVRFYSV